MKKSIGILRTLKTLAVAVPAMLASVLPGASFAAENGPKVAVFDAQMIYMESNAAKRAGAELRSKQEQANQRIETMEKPLIEKQKELASNKSNLSGDKLELAQETLRKDYLTYRSEASRISQDFEKAQFKARKDIADAMRAAVQEIAKEKGYDIVLPKGMALYSAPSVPDISAEVLSKVNARLK